ncbi:MAG: serine/threonine protein kinase, partial [Planctomycetales bacterium]|nr:serine/threonine protein kinase [Planctomycetales bacterium]
MGITSRSLLQSAALRSGLVTAAQIERALDAVRALHNIPSFLNVSDEELSEQMVFMKMLTPYQAEQLKAGRAKLTLGPYVITDWIAQGGMGQVFKAEHKLMGREVAIKVLPYHRSTPEAIENFTLEIRTQAKLDHENLVRAYDAGHDGKVYFLVTEFVPGTDLRRLLRTEGPLRAQHAASIITQAAKGLQAAHDLGLIHRDVKPANILIEKDGRARLADFGIALRRGAEDGGPPVAGTPQYMAP